MNQSICHVVGAGDFSPSLLTKNAGDLRIAADAGYRHVKEAGIRADLYVGDGDSLLYTPEGIDTLILPSVKDDTDTLAALKEGLRRGYRRFHLYGALGGKRVSHSLANLQRLFFLADQGAEGTLVDENATVTLLPPGDYKMDLEGGYFSLFATSENVTLSLSGAKYSGQNLTLTPHFPLGVSNEGTKETLLQIHKGTLILVREP